MIDCPSILLVRCRSVFESWFEKIQFLCALLDNINWLYSWAGSLTTLYAFGAHWFWIFLEDSEKTSETVLSFFWTTQILKLCHHRGVAFRFYFTLHLFLRSTTGETDPEGLFFVFIYSDQWPLVKLEFHNSTSIFSLRFSSPCFGFMYHRIS